MPSPLSISSNQNSSILAPLNTTMSEALGGGVDIPGPTVLIPGLTGWNTLPTAQQQTAIDTFRQTLAAFIVAMGFDQVGLGSAGTPKVVSYIKPDTSTGTLTFIGGLLVAST